MTYEINMRQDKRTGDFLAVYPESETGLNGRYYTAYTLLDGHVEVSPEYLTQCTKTVSEWPPELKHTIDSINGRILITVDRLKG